MKKTENKKTEKGTPDRKKLPAAKPSPQSQPKLQKIIRRKGILKPGEQLKGQLTLANYL